MQLTGMKALARAIEIIGSQVAAAKVVGVTPQAVSEILRKGKRVPAEWCIPIEGATKAAGERITRHQLRPDLYPDDPAPTASGKKPGSKSPRGSRAEASA